jgi:hypothetical protein
VPVPTINRAVIHAVNVGRSIARRRARSADLATNRKRQPAIGERWQRQLPDVPLVIVESPYRALVGPLLAYLDVLDETWPKGEEAADHIRGNPRVRRAQLVERLLYNQSAKRLRQVLIGRPHTVVVGVPYRR